MTGTKVQTANGKEKKKSLQLDLEGAKFKTELRKLLPKVIPPDRFVRVALTAMQKTPDLALCTGESFFQALLTLAELGLEPDGRRAHLIPFNDRKKGKMVAQLIIDYKGYVELMLNNGDAATIHGDIICTGEEFIYDRGRVVKHIVDPFTSKRGTKEEKVVGAYVIIRMKDGSEKCEMMTTAEIDKVKGRSKAKEFGPWKSDENEMRKKTVLRRCSKWMKLSPKVVRAFEADFDHVETFQEQENEKADPPATPVANNAQGVEQLQAGDAPDQDQGQNEPPPTDDEQKGQDEQREPGQDDDKDPALEKGELFALVRETCKGNQAQMRSLLKRLTTYKRKDGVMSKGKEGIDELSEAEAHWALLKLKRELGE